LIEVTNEKTAESTRFLGSPSVRVNGVDIEPGREDDIPFEVGVSSGNSFSGVP
jgi:hypothetical protein